MGFADVLGAEKTVDLKVSEIFSLFKESALLNAENKIMLNGYKKHIEHDVVLTLLGKKEEIIESEE